MGEGKGKQALRDEVWGGQSFPYIRWVWGGELSLHRKK